MAVELRYNIRKDVLIDVGGKTTKILNNLPAQVSHYAVMLATSKVHIQYIRGEITCSSKCSGKSCSVLQSVGC